MSTRQTSRAFTLIELLVAIGIIALLLGILLPSLRKARQASERPQCASNLRQIGIAMRTYAAENRDALPWAMLQWGLPTHSSVSWDDLLDPYLGKRLDEAGQQAWTSPRDNPILHCPSDGIPPEPDPLLFKRSYEERFAPAARSSRRSARRITCGRVAPTTERRRATTSRG